jgi:hypothetical protein
MAGVMSDIVDLIRHRKAIYAAALEGDLARLRIAHGKGLIDEAMRLLIEQDEERERRRQQDRVA